MWNQVPRCANYKSAATIETSYFSSNLKWRILSNANERRNYLKTFGFEDGRRVGLKSGRGYVLHHIIVLLHKPRLDVKVSAFYTLITLESRPVFLIFVHQTKMPTLATTIQDIKGFVTVFWLVLSILRRFIPCEPSDLKYSDAKNVESKCVNKDCPFNVISSTNTPTSDLHLN